MRHSRGGVKYRETAAAEREHGLAQREKRTAVRVNSARIVFTECCQTRYIVFLSSDSKKDCQNALWTSSINRPMGVAAGDGSPVMEVRGAEPQLVDHRRETLKRMDGSSGRTPTGRLAVPDGPETTRLRTARRTLTTRTKAMTCWKPKVAVRRETGNHPRVVPRRALAPLHQPESRKRLCRWTTAEIQ